MLGINEIKKHNREQQQHLMVMFGDKDIEKAISPTEFKERYESDHEIFSSEGIESFEKAISEQIEEHPEKRDELISNAAEEMSALSKVLVKGEDSKITPFYVKKAESKDGGSVAG